MILLPVTNAIKFCDPTAIDFSVLLVTLRHDNRTAI